MLKGFVDGVKVGGNNPEARSFRNQTPTGRCSIFSNTEPFGFQHWPMPHQKQWLGWKMACICEKLFWFFSKKKGWRQHGICNILHSRCRKDALFSSFPGLFSSNFHMKNSPNSLADSFNHLWDGYHRIPRPTPRPAVRESQEILELRDLGMPYSAAFRWYLPQSFRLVLHSEFCCFLKPLWFILITFVDSWIFSMSMLIVDSMLHFFWRQ